MSSHDVVPTVAPPSSSGLGQCPLNIIIILGLVTRREVSRPATTAQQLASQVLLLIFIFIQCLKWSYFPFYGVKIYYPP